MSAPILSIGVVGAGTIAHNVHLPVLVNLPATRIAWIADQDPPRAARLARANGVCSAAVGDDLKADVVLLAMPLPGREPWLRQFAAKGGAVLVEKPFASDAEQHRAWQALFPPYAIGVGYQRRFHATSLFVAQAVCEGWFGPLRRIVHREGGRKTRVGGASYADLSVAQGGGVTKNLGCHGIDLAFHLSGASDFRIVRRKVEFDGDVDRHMAATLELSGPHGACEFDVVTSWLERQSNEILYQFERATLRFPVTPSATLTIASDGGTPATLDVRANGGAVTTNQAFFCEWAAFLDGVRHQRESKVSAASALIGTSAIDALVAREARP